MVKEIIKKHDQMSFEAKFEFPANGKSGKGDGFNVDMFLFLPYGIDINKHNLTKEDFYNSLKTNIRLTTPFFELKEMIEGGTSPYLQLKKSIEAFISKPNAKMQLEYEKQLKRYCSIFKVALRYDSIKISKSRSEEKRMKLVANYKKNIEQSRLKFKNLNHNITDKKALSVFRHADEYQSILIENTTAWLIKPASKIIKQNIVHEKLFKIVVDEMDYRIAEGYPSAGVKNMVKVDLLHRKGRLKKFIDSNLYLNTDTKKEGVVVEQILFSIAAGIAMVFATGVAFASQMLYGSLSLPFFIALVIGYMFKDRMKELARFYFSKKQQKLIYDFKTNIYSQEKKKIGSLKESFSFDRHSFLNEEILKQRNMMRATEITEESLGEKIIHYRTKVKIRSKTKTLIDFAGLTQILRFNISDFTRKMDDPEKEVLLRTKNGFKRVFLDRVYHINLILTYSDNNNSVIRPYKIFASKKGIRRIEKALAYN